MAEWTETSDRGAKRQLRGGAFGQDSPAMRRTADQFADFDTEHERYGFRVATTVAAQ